MNDPETPRDGAASSLSPMEPSPAESAQSASAQSAPAGSGGSSGRHRRSAEVQTQTTIPLGAIVAALPDLRTRPGGKHAAVVGAQSSPSAAEPSGSRAGRNLPAAIGVGLALAASIIATLLLYRPSFVALVIATATYGGWELIRALSSLESRLPLVPLLLGGAGIEVSAWARGPSGLAMAFMIVAAGLVVWRLGEGAARYGEDVTRTLFVLLYVPTLAAFAVLLARPDDGAGRVIAFVAVVVCSDVGGYAAGVFFGKHLLAPVVSKGKTWEGFAGSVAACSLCGILLMTLTFHHPLWQGELFGLAIVVTATLGDLGESMIKRDLGIKDMGNLLPGHGGMMDRLDSLLPCAAVAYLVFSACLGTR